MKSVFDQDNVVELTGRIEQLKNDSQPQWGKMNVSQMLAHCNVTYELIYDNIHPKPGAFKKVILKLLVKNLVVNEKPYKKNSPTASEFLISSARDFELERKRLKDYIVLTLSNGSSYFEGKESHSFGKLTTQEWNNMMCKHLDHHLTQFGV